VSYFQTRVVELVRPVAKGRGVSRVKPPERFSGRGD